MQAISPALLRAVRVHDGSAHRSMVLRELQPFADRLSLAEWGGKVGRLRKIVCSMGRLLAWSQLRSSGRDGSATADELIAFGARSDWPRAMLRAARGYQSTIRADYAAYSTAYDAHDSRLQPGV
jgi:hypothetical protein